MFVVVVAFFQNSEPFIEIPKSLILIFSSLFAGGEGIPVVLIVLEGGRDAIEDAKTSLGQNIPVILCEGTGRAADILVTAYNLGDV